MNEIALFISVFLACAVEAVEATTIVLAAGTARDWRSAYSGVFAGLVVLGAIIAIAGPAISRLPFSALRMAVGGLLLVFGLQWLRKAILRGSGYKALHDEDRIFQEELSEARAAQRISRTGVKDWYAFTLSFKGVVLEGLEVAFIVLTFGTIQHRVDLASIAALSAVVIVALAGFAVHKPLSRVPENNMKFTVGIMLTSFGIFWGAEGSGAKWPGDNAALLGLIIFVSAISFLLVFVLRKHRERGLASASVVESLAPVESAALTHDELIEELDIITVDSAEVPHKTFVENITAFGAFWYDFIIGDDWRMAAGIVVAFAATGWLKSAGSVSWPLVPITVATLLSYSLFRVIRSLKAPVPSKA
jgi:uncharacterized membrane protein